jgi:replicative DNA helicase
MQNSDYTMPFSEIVENQAIASFLSDKTIFSDFSGLVLPEYFYQTNAEKIFKFMVENNCIDALVLMEKFPEDIAYIASCLETVASTTNLCAHVEILKDRYFRRVLITAAKICQQEAIEINSEITTDQIIDNFQKELFKIQNHNTHQPQLIGEILPQVFAQIEAANKRQGGGVLTGLSDIDSAFGGFMPGELIVIAGRSSMGKSAFAFHIVCQNSVKNKAPGLIYSLEMSKTLTTARILFSTAMVDYDAAQRGVLPQSEYPKLSLAAEPLSESEIYINESSELTVSQMAIQAEKLRMDKSIEYVIIDHLQLVNHPDSSKSMHHQIGDITRQLHGLAKKLEVPIILLSQLNRSVEGRKPPRPQLSDLRESGSIEENSDKVVFLYRPDYYDENNEPGIVEVIYGKNRNGRTGFKKVKFDKPTMSFFGLAKDNENNEGWYK